MTQKEKNHAILKFTIHASAMLNELDRTKTNTEHSEQLKQPLERILDEAYETDVIHQTNFLQTLENRFDTVIRKTSQEFKIRI